ncbi:protein henna-like [Xenia sp. Carnegie-2017]|uniref:protein henna-like n=1 Tax=Xenia sp. Carnegie-2017 TaxID=2897299 RepID=UPI001F03AACA|nr:protein henna-like [Xenia sp. Carnegie-2017]
MNIQAQVESKKSKVDSQNSGYAYIPGVRIENPKTSLVFALKEEVGTLHEALKVFKDYGINLTHIESRPADQESSYFEFYVDCSGSKENLNPVLKTLEKNVKNVKVLPGEDEETLWFPKNIADLDEFANRICSYGSELDADHPGFTDPVYRARRKEFADIAFNYKHGEPIPNVTYTQDEIKTWNKIFSELSRLFKTHACKEHNAVWPLLVESCGYREGNIPQLQVVSNYLKGKTGFTLRPVAGLLSSRDFLAGLAFRVFHSTQYIRHGSKPLYTPEPDICHELIGHVPLFADPDFAQFSQEIGLASLGAPDEWIKRLATLYWFTVEFGVCRQNGALKAYGAGLLSSFGELQYCMSDKPTFKDFDPEKIADTEYPITEYQPIYFVAESFKSAKEKVREYATKIARPYQLRYNPYTQSIEVLDRKDKVVSLISEMKSDMDVLHEALKHL